MILEKVKRSASGFIEVKLIKIHTTYHVRLVQWFVNGHVFLNQSVVYTVYPNVRLPELLGWVARFMGRNNVFGWELENCPLLWKCYDMTDVAYGVCRLKEFVNRWTRINGDVKYKGHHEDRLVAIDYTKTDWKPTLEDLFEVCFAIHPIENETSYQQPRVFP